MSATAGSCSAKYATYLGGIPAKVTPLSLTYREGGDLKTAWTKKNIYIHPNHVIALHYSMYQEISKLNEE